MKIPYSPTIMLVDSHVAIYKIYVLKNPVTDEVFYVGQTMLELSARLSGHLSGTGSSNREKIHFIQNLIRQNIRPVIEAIEVIPTKCYIDKVMVNERELYWIKFYKEKGCSLLNKAAINTDGTHYEYKNYLSSIKRGETKYHYYVCGKTKGGHEVYDEQKLRADGFVLNIPNPDPPKVKPPASIETSFMFENRYLNWRLSKMMGLEIPTKAKVITTEIFPEQPQWSKEFSDSIPYDGLIDECENWRDEDLEPDIDDEPDYDDEDEGLDEYHLLPNEQGVKMSQHIVDYFYGNQYYLKLLEET